MGRGKAGMKMYQRRPPERGELVLKAPNMDSTFVDKVLMLHFLDTAEKREP